MLEWEVSSDLILDEIISDHLSSLTSEGTVGGNVSQPVWRREIVCNEVGHHFSTPGLEYFYHEEFPTFSKIYTKNIDELFKEQFPTIFESWMTRIYVNFTNFSPNSPIQPSSPVSKNWKYLSPGSLSPGN